MEVELWKYMVNRRTICIQYFINIVPPFHAVSVFQIRFVFHSKVLWPSMDKWVKKRKGHETAQSIPDTVIALTLRLIGK